MAAIEFLLDAAELAESIEGAMAAADAPPTPTGSNNWMSVTIVNHTQFVLTPVDSYFYSGRFAQAPAIVGPFKAMTFTVTTPDVSVFTGETGAATFILNPVQNVACRLGAGFSNPAFGTYKSNVAFDADLNQPDNSNPVLFPISLFTVGTYNGNTPNTITAVSAKFTGNDRKGAPITIQFIGSASSGQQAAVSIVQTIVSGGQ